MRGQTAESIHDSLRQDIVAGRIKPGQRMTLAILAEQFNTPTSVVRKSVDHLKKHGYVESRRKWGPMSRTTPLRNGWTTTACARPWNWLPCVA